MKRLNDLEEAATQQEDLQALKNLVTLNESFKSQEAAFKASCKAQMLDFKAKIAALDSEEMDATTQENKNLKNIEDMHEKVKNS
jgi:oligoendopeptidase F